MTNEVLVMVDAIFVVLLLFCFIGLSLWLWNRNAVLADQLDDVRASADCWRQEAEVLRQKTYDQDRTFDEIRGSLRKRYGPHP